VEIVGMKNWAARMCHDHWVGVGLTSMNLLAMSCYCDKFGSRFSITFCSPSSGPLPGGQWLLELAISNAVQKSI